MKRIVRAGLKLVRVVKWYLNDPSLIYARSNDPDFLILGAQKSGTSSLFNWLGQHPQMRGSVNKELHYFNNGIYFGKDLRWYRQQFPGKAVLHFEATPAYIYSATTCENIHRTYPHIKMIVILRNPVDRAFSAYNHYRSVFAHWRQSDAIKNKQYLRGDRLHTSFFQDREVFPSFRECIDIELDLANDPEIFEPSILRRGVYLPQLQNYINCFGPDKLMIIGFKDLTERTTETLNAICTFLGADPFDWTRVSIRPQNQRSYPNSLSDEDRAFLEAYYKEPNEELLRAFGTFNW